LEIASSGRHGWELTLHDKPSPMGHSGELLTAIVEDAWSESEPLTRLAASARAFRRRQLDWSRAGGASQGPPPRHPVHVMRADSAEMTGFAGGRAHVARVTAASQAEASAKRAALRDEAGGAGRDPDGVKVLVDLTVTLAQDPAHAEARKDLAEEIMGQRLGGDGIRFVGTPAALAEACVEWVAEESCDGFTFLPTSLPEDLMLVVSGVAPVLAAAGHLPTAYRRRQWRHGAAPRAMPVPRVRAESRDPLVRA
jgi:alkanesulfonate monooxygenase SsuD/methylene tetrahydromethanopterin reductase-like flavin-dependent oxidoreductase (luciferase family)